MPEAVSKPDGQPRHVGVEIELQGVEPGELASVCAAALDGTVREISRSEYIVDVDGHGEYRIERDFALLKSLARRENEPAGKESSTVEGLAIDALDAASALLVPCEIVTPPIPMQDVAAPVERIVEATRRAGGRGTRHSALYAFGVHLNIEPWAMQPGVVRRYMQAFVCLFDWIAWKGAIDLSRRITPYIDRYPSAYEEALVRSNDPACWQTLITDYIDANPTRNRALDMLPLFAHVDPAAVRGRIDDDRIQARPAFHYRLANSCVDEPDWGVREPWSRWLQVERLAADERRLATVREAFIADRRRPLRRLDNEWRLALDQWLNDPR